MKRNTEIFYEIPNVHKWTEISGLVVTQNVYGFLYTTKRSSPGGDMYITLWLFRGEIPSEGMPCGVFHTYPISQYRRILEIEAIKISEIELADIILTKLS